MTARDQLASYLKTLRARLRLGALLRGAAALVAVALTATLVLALITNAFGFSDSSLFAARIVLILALATVVGFGVALPWRALSERRAARKAEAAFPQFDQRLVTFAERDRGARDPFLELLAADTLQVAKSAQPRNMVSQGKLAAWIASAAAALAVLVWLIAAGPGFLGYGAARLWAGSLRSTPPFYDIQVTPGDAAVRRHANQMVTAQVTGRQVEGARLYARYQSASKWDQVNMQRQRNGNGFEFLFAGLPENVEYYIEAGPLVSRHFKLRVVDLPAVKQIRVTYHFPAWTGMKDAVEEHGGDLRALEGTEARLNVLLSQPVGHSFLVLDGGKQIDLAAGDRNFYNGSVHIEKDGMYHVAALDGSQQVRLSEDFFIEARKVNAPDVRITRPVGEYHASPIEEVTVTAQANDDFGLNSLTLHYSVNGGPEQTANLLKQKGAKQADGSTTLYLEDFKLVPGDLVSLYASAKDARTESHTDMTFIQAEPFSRDYSQSQIMGGGGGGGMGGQQEQISQREKEIIAETWKHQLDKNASKQDLTEAAKFLSGVQSKLHDQALSLAGRLERRELTDENAEFSSFQKDMGAAAQAMQPAAQALQQQKWKDAMPQEQKALQYLLRAEATFRQIEVAFGSSAGGGGGGSGRDLQSLFDLELDTEKNQYETEQTANSANQQSEEIDKALQKLDELARRQEELAQQPRKSQDFQSRWQQEMLRREAEKLQEQMAQLARNGSQQGGSGSQQSASNPQPGNSGSQQGGSGSSRQASSGGGQGGSDMAMQQALDRLRQAGDDMRRAASPGQGQDGADARRAADRLREASDMLNRMRGQDGSQQLDSLAREGERLSGEQRDQAQRMRQAFGGGQGQSQSSLDDLSKLAGDRQGLADDLARLEKQMQAATRSLASGQRAAASKLRDALAGMDQSDLRNKLQRSAEMIRRGMDPNATPSEAAINSGIEQLNEQLRQAQQALSGGQQNPEEALERMARLRNQIEALTRNSGDRGGQAGNQGARAGERNGQLPNGAGLGGGGGVGTDLQHGAAGGNYNGGRWDGDRFYGGYDPGSFTKAQGTERKPTPLTQADIERAYQEAQRDLDELRRTVRGDPGPLGDIRDLQRELDHLDPRRFPGNPAMLEELHSQVLTSLDKLELQLRRQSDDKQSGQVRSGDAQRVPDGYRESVASYFRRLSQSK